MRVLVTGGAGFIGSAIVDLLVGDGHDVVVVDALLDRAHRREPEYLNPAATYVIGDIADRVLADDAVRGIDAVCHQAALVGLGVDLGDIVDYVDHNDRATAVLLRALHDRRFKGRVVLASSMVVYGEGRYRCSRHGVVRPAARASERLDAGRFEPPCPRCGRDLVAEPVAEDAPTDPRNVYAATKVHQEHLCAAWARESGASVLALRYHNVYGPRMPRDTPYAGVAAIFRSALARGVGPVVFEDGRQRRDFVHVSDVARANRAALLADPSVHGPFNIATGEPRTVLDLATALTHASGAASLRPSVVGTYRLGDVRHVFASADRAATELGFRTSVSFASGVRDFAHCELRT
jgi:dTDP-L-rhamnose 4-epimerase